MPNLATVMKDEIQRLARKEIRSETAVLKRQSAQHRRDIAALKRENAELKRTVEFLKKREAKRIPAADVKKVKDKQVRFSPKWLKTHREKLGLSAADYAKLIDVSPLSIYNWEQGKTTPRRKQVEALASVRTLGKREAQQRLEVIEAG